VWGLIHGLLLVLERVLKALTGDAAWAQTAVVRFAIGLATFGAVCFAWAFFRATDFTTAARIVRAMAGVLPGGAALLSTREIIQVFGVVGGLLLAHWLLRDTSLETVVARRPRWLIVTVWSVMLSAIMLTQGSGNAFIYFQF